MRKSSPTSKPVSYTHLDVYKRQDDDHVLKQKARLYGGDFCCKTDCDFIEKIKAVSYTHLDVYKRQASDYLQSGSLETVQSELNTGLTVYDTQNSMQVGDTVTLQIGGQPVEIQITGLLSTSPFNTTGDSGIIIVSEDTFRQITGEENYTIIDMQLSTSATDDDVLLPCSSFRWTDPRWQIGSVHSK